MPASLFRENVPEISLTLLPHHEAAQHCTAASHIIERQYLSED